MAHSASTGGAKRTVNVIGKRLGIKRFGGQLVNAGEIVLRQRGSEFYPGKNTFQGKDFSIHAEINGVVSFRQMSGYKRNQKYVDVMPAVAEVKKAAKPAKVEVEATTEAPKKAAKKTTKTIAKKATK